MASNAWFEWQYYHPAEAECAYDCLARTAAFAAGRRLGRQEMLNLTTQWAQLTPLLGSLLEELATLREEREVERAVIESDLRPAF